MSNPEKDMRNETPKGVLTDFPSGEECFESDAPTPPDAQSISRDYRDLAQEAAAIRAREATRAREAKRKRIAAVGIAITGVVLVIVAAVGAFMLTHPGDIAGRGGDSGGVSQDAPTNDDASSGEHSAENPSEEEDAIEGDAFDSDSLGDEGGVSAVEAVVATDQIRASFSALASDKDGVFTGFVQAFMDDYDRGVNTEVSYTLADLGIEPSELSEALLSGFSCTVDDVEIHGQTAWVNVSVTSKSLADQADTFARTVESSGESGQDEESYKAFLKRAFFEAFDSVSPRSHELLITVERSKEGWSVDDSAFEYILGSIWYTSA